MVCTVDTVVPPRSLKVPLPSSACVSPVAMYIAVNAGPSTFWKIVLDGRAALSPKQIEGPGSSEPFPQAPFFLAKDRCGSTEAWLLKVDKV